MGKLVREEVMSQKKTTEASNPERPTRLLAKLTEEGFEWLLAEDHGERLRELADLQEVVWSLGKVDGISAEEITGEAVLKRQGRGSFDDLVIMDVVEVEQAKIDEDVSAVLAAAAATAARERRVEPAYREPAYRGFDGPGYSG